MLNKEDPRIVIHIRPNSEGGLEYDVFTEDDDWLYEAESEDGGICTSGEDEPGPHKLKDWEAALGMATDAALEIIRKSGAK
jgi:hypothetical protein